jgi:hypothetical protein
MEHNGQWIDTRHLIQIGDIQTYRHKPSKFQIWILKTQIQIKIWTKIQIDK